MKVKTGTPKTTDCVAPQIIPRNQTEVTVPESSSVRLSNSGFNPRLRYVFANILPGTTIAKYWSEAVTLKNRHVTTVDATSDVVVFAY